MRAGIFLSLICAAGLACTGPLRAADEGTAWDHLVDEQVVEHGDGTANHVRVFAADGDSGPWLSIIPSLGRGVEDYTEDYHSTLTRRFVEAGYRVVLVQPRGIGRSRGDLTPENLSMGQFANDLKRSFDALGITQVSLIGHAFGNRLARTFATLYPDMVDNLALMASGGNFAMSEEQQSCLRGSFNLSLAEPERLKALACAFFAVGNDASVWLEGWYPELAAAEVHAANMVNGDFFKAAGGVPFLLVQAGEDFIAPPDKAGRVLEADLGDQVTYAEVPHAGHALSSEQPDIVAAIIIAHFQRN
ncbi:alpha/beta fold hydrolase [Oceanomicrobium pacificus]|uniref:Alpha/beta fold hydrolase n=1 Tax=Oceanomicrobium pacificus TaxID=2692916 RepID=A0A6B0TMV4_9RHOB|nr:alpha/beta hydrolase [Oceanomicrobium pacificus]MXU65857.1 alpha/beta fold hydrolase [Oceanomicrobium pacificus]